MGSSQLSMYCIVLYCTCRLVFEERGKPEYPEKNLSEQTPSLGSSVAALVTGAIVWYSKQLLLFLSLSHCFNSLVFCFWLG